MKDGVLYTALSSVSRKTYSERLTRQRYGLLLLTCSTSRDQKTRVNVIVKAKAMFTASDACVEMEMERRAPRLLQGGEGCRWSSQEIQERVAAASAGGCFGNAVGAL